MAECRRNLDRGCAGRLRAAARDLEGFPLPLGPVGGAGLFIAVGWSPSARRRHRPAHSVQQHSSLDRQAILFALPVALADLCSAALDVGRAGTDLADRCGGLDVSACLGVLPMGGAAAAPERASAAIPCRPTDFLLP